LTEGSDTDVLLLLLELYKRSLINRSQLRRHRQWGHGLHMLGILVTMLLATWYRTFRRWKPKCLGSSHSCARRRLNVS